VIALTQLDASILLWIQEHLRTPFFTGFWRLITMFGEAGIFWIALVLLLLILPKKRPTGIRCAISLLIVFLLTYAIKYAVARPRPYDAIAQLTPLVPKLSDFSFPSGHTSAAFAVSLVLTRTERKRVWIPFLILSCLIAFSRLYLGVHYPSDVICGFLLALIGSTVVLKMFERFSARVPKWRPERPQS
jgi:membrane-associated phospholipid phosphatase